jgi:outer membrane protein insertion porin family
MAGIIFWVAAGLFAQASSKQTPANKISAIIIEGTQNVKEKTIRNELKSRVNKPYSEEIVKTDIQNILSLGSFENVEVRVDTATWKVTFQIKEKPLVTNISFKGNKKFSAGRLKDETTLKEKDFYDLAKFEESKTKIVNLYSEKGYADVKLDAYPTIDESKNKMTVTFLITEGNRILIGDVHAEGVNAYKPKKILGLMKTKRKKVFKEDTLREDRTNIEKFYKNNGFMDVKIDEPKIAYNAERTSMFITIPITEGVKYKIGGITFSGNTVFPQAELQKIMSIRRGQLYNDEKLQESRQAILEMYADRGYLHSQVELSFEPDNDKGIMNVNFAIAEGEIIYLGNVFIDGLNYTKEYVIRREVLLKEGDVFSSGKVKRSLEKIYNLGFIDSVEPQIQPTEKPNVMDLVMSVSEGKPGILSAGAGYSSVDQLVGTLQVQHVNLFGRGQRLNLLWEFGARKQNYEINWTEPWFMSKPMSLAVGLFNTERNYDYASVISAYKEGRKGGSVTVGPRLSDKLSLQFSYSYEDIRVFDVSADSAVASNVVPSQALTSSISSQIVWDSRDNIFDATRGNRQSFSAQFAGGPLGGDINFIKPIARSAWFFPTFWKFVLSVNAQVGLIENFSPSTDVPIYQRFYVGGADTVRGYQYRTEIGPAEGGKEMFVMNVEYKFPIAEEKKHTILQGAIFYDVGGAWRSGNDVNLTLGEGETNLKAGIGFGLRFTTPVFPLRLDWGYGFNHRPGEQLSQFYFTIGNIF